MAEEEIKKETKAPVEDAKKVVEETETTEEVIEETPAKDDQEYAAQKKDSLADFSEWVPKTELGKKIKSREITDIGEAFAQGYKILEPEIVDVLLPGLESELLMIGQSKGKFGGGQKRVFRQTQKKTREGNKPHFATMAIVGNRNGYIGMGYGKSKETVPAREKAVRNAKLNLIKIRRGSGSWESNAKEPHSIPFAVEGKEGSVKLRLMPAPKGAGLVTEKEVQKILRLAGIKDVWSKTSGHTKTKTNLIMAAMKALEQLHETKIQPNHHKTLSIVEGSVSSNE